MTSAARRSMPARVLEISHPDRGIYGVIVVDSLGQLGRAFGGVRRRDYASRGEVMEDALALAHAMSQKCALAGLPVGGAKTALWVSQPDPQQLAYELVAEEVERLAGAYVCGPDVGTDEARLDVMRRRTRWVNPAGNAPGERTAQGVMAGMRAAAAAALGSRAFRGRTVTVLGLGAVGGSLARRLLEDGARVLGFDPVPERRAAAAAMGVEVIEEERAAWESDCDVLAPCALGGALTGGRAERLRASVICGAANNLLADDAVAEQLHARGVLLVPDVMVNAGAVIEGVYTVLETLGTTLPGSVDAHVDDTEARCSALLLTARSQGISPFAALRGVVPG